MAAFARHPTLEAWLSAVVRASLCEAVTAELLRLVGELAALERPREDEGHGLLDHDAVRRRSVPGVQRASQGDVAAVPDDRGAVLL